MATATAAKIAETFGVIKPAKRPYLQVKNELEKARQTFAELNVEHETMRQKSARYEVWREAKAKDRQRAVAAGVIMADGDFNPAYIVPPKMTIPPILQEKYHRQHYICADLEAEEASYTASEKSRAFVESPVDSADA